MWELISAVSGRSVGDSEVRLLPHTSRSFTTFINQNASALWGVFNCSKDDGKSRLYGM